MKKKRKSPLPTGRDHTDGRHICDCRCSKKGGGKSKMSGKQNRVFCLFCCTNCGSVYQKSMQDSVSECRQKGNEAAKRMSGYTAGGKITRFFGSDRFSLNHS